MAIEYPQLEIRDEAKLAAEAIGKTTGTLSVEQIDSQIANRQELRNLIILNALSTPICPELTNANPSAPHTVLLEAMAWLLAQIAWRLNQTPQQNLIAFANVFGIEPIEATEAETILRFTVTFNENEISTIPAGTTVSDVSATYQFETLDDLVIDKLETVGETLAVRTEFGHTLLSPNVLTELLDNLSFVESVTNPNGVDSGTQAETTESVLSRVAEYQRRGERIVTSQDLEDAILDEALYGNGVVRAFPFIANGDFSGDQKVGYTTVVAMTKRGDAIDDNSRSYIADLLEEIVGNQFVYIANPMFVNFNISCTVRLRLGAIQSATIAAIEANLRTFYATAREQFGRSIYRSEIIAIIEGTAGVERIESSGNSILESPQTDVRLEAYQLPKLNAITINVL